MDCWVAGRGGRCLCCGWSSCHSSSSHPPTRQTGPGYLPDKTGHAGSCHWDQQHIPDGQSHTHRRFNTIVFYILKPFFFLHFIYFLISMTLVRYMQILQTYFLGFKCDLWLIILVASKKKKKNSCVLSFLQMDKQRAGLIYIQVNRAKQLYKHLQIRINKIHKYKNTCCMFIPGNSGITEWLCCGSDHTTMQFNYILYFAPFLLWCQIGDNMHFLFYFMYPFRSWQGFPLLLPALSFP